MQELSLTELARLADYIARELSPADAAAVEQWIAASPARQAFVAYLDRARLVPAAHPTRRLQAPLGSQVELLVRALAQETGQGSRPADPIREHPEARITEPEPGRETVASVGSRTPLQFPHGHGHGHGDRGLFVRSGTGRRWPARLLRTAAAVAAGLVVVAGLRAYWHGDVGTGFRTTRTYRTHAGQQAAVELVDGTRIVLAPRTTLTVTSGTRQQARDVSLVGEAHFDVVASHDAPFVVRTGTVTTRVLGTTFDVRRYATDSVGRVVVMSGKVVTQGHGTPVTLSAGMAGEFTDSSVTARVVEDPASYAAWLQGELVFRDTPVPVMLETLKRWYGYEFRLNDSTLIRRHVTTVFTIGETGDMMWRLKRLLGVTLSFQDSVVTLKPTDTDSAPPLPAVHKLKTPLTPTREVGR